MNNFKRIIGFAILIISLSVLTKCKDSDNNIADCDGYTGEVTSKPAKVLVAKCHFMGKDSIDSWTARYTRNKKDIGTATLPVQNVLGDSCSFNNSIVRAIITNDSCIGLRVINGMDAANKIHVILVGIKPDYSTLYIKKPKDCTVAENLNKNSGDPEDELGGGEMAETP
jgi:hypothetical protein